MDTPRTCDKLLLASLLVAAVLMPACSGTAQQTARVPENGFTQTRNYQFQALIRADSLGNCKSMMVRVRALSKLYSGQEPPSRLRLFDDDCVRPVQFERVQYISRETQDHVRLSGSDVARFFSDNVRLEDELMGWLWHEGVI